MWICERTQSMYQSKRSKAITKLFHRVWRNKNEKASVTNSIWISRLCVFGKEAYSKVPSHQNVSKRSEQKESACENKTELSVQTLWLNSSQDYFRLPNLISQVVFLGFSNSAVYFGSAVNHHNSLIDDGGSLSHTIGSQTGQTGKLEMSFLTSQMPSKNAHTPLLQSLL